MNNTYKQPLIVLSVLVIAAVACGQFSLGIEAPPISADQQNEDQAILLATSSNPSPIASSIPPTQETSPTPSQANIYMIATGDNGASGKKIGCDDSVVPVFIPIPASLDPVMGALEALLSIHDQNYGQSGLYNSLYQSTLKVDSVKTDNKGGATVNLSGVYQLGGECDDPRFRAQIEETVLQFPQIKTVEIFINNISLDDILSGKGQPPSPTDLTYDKVSIFLIALNDNGAGGPLVGCGDSAIPVEVQITHTQDPVAALTFAIQALLSAGDRYTGGAGFYNALKNSSLNVVSVTIQDANATIKLSGALQSGGQCDDPRIKAQLEQTVRQFSQLTRVSIYLNDQLFYNYP
jgi:Sporulation and spore germination